MCKIQALADRSARRASPSRQQPKPLYCHRDNSSSTVCCLILPYHYLTPLPPILHIPHRDAACCVILSTIALPKRRVASVRKVLFEVVRGRIPGPPRLCMTQSCVIVDNLIILSPVGIVQIRNRLLVILRLLQHPHRAFVLACARTPASVIIDSPGRSSTDQLVLRISPNVLLVPPAQSTCSRRRNHRDTRIGNFLGCRSWSRRLCFSGRCSTRTSDGDVSGGDDFRFLTLAVCAR